MGQMIRFFSMDQYHGKQGTGSVKIRVNNLLKYWPEAGLYRYGEKPDVLIFQKVYITFDYKFPRNFNGGLKILDICDPDYNLSPDVFLKETLDEMDAVVVPTKTLQGFLSRMTNTRVLIIKDRFDISEFPPPKKHEGEAKTVVWFGYVHNAELLKFAIQSLERRDLNLVVISNEDPMAYKWAADSKAYELKYKFHKYNQNIIYKDLQKADICILPMGSRPHDKYKSENKTIQAQLCGLPVAKTAEEVDALMTAKARNEAVAVVYEKLKQDYDARRSVKEYKQLIDQLIKERKNG